MTQPWGGEPSPGAEAGVAGASPNAGDGLTGKEFPATFPRQRHGAHSLRDDQKVDEAEQGGQDEGEHHSTGEVLVLELVVLQTEPRSVLRCPGHTQGLPGPGAAAASRSTAPAQAGREKGPGSRPLLRPSPTFRSRSACLYLRVKKSRSAISRSIWRASRRRPMYLFTRVPGVV